MYRLKVYNYLATAMVLLVLSLSAPPPPPTQLWQIIEYTLTGKISELLKIAGFLSLNYFGIRFLRKWLM